MYIFCRIFETPEMLSYHMSVEHSQDRRPDPSTGYQVGTETELTLESGDSLNGIYSGTIVLTPEISDGHYQVAVFAANAETVEGDFNTYAVNGDTVIILERDNSGPDEPDDTPSDTNDKKDKGCCKVSINISSGPVNIYVCGTESKINTLE